jgi:hypothetical protein
MNDYELWVNAERTVLVRRYPSGEVEVAVRETPDDIWRPPIRCEKEEV